MEVLYEHAPLEYFVVVAIVFVFLFVFVFLVAFVVVFVFVFVYGVFVCIFGRCCVLLAPFLSLGAAFDVLRCPRGDPWMSSSSFLSSSSSPSSFSSYPN